MNAPLHGPLVFVSLTTDPQRPVVAVAGSKPGVVPTYTTARGADALLDRLRLAAERGERIRGSLSFYGPEED